MEPLKIFHQDNATIICDTFAYEKRPEIRVFMESPEFRHIIQMVQEKFIMVLGGDGTMLRAVQSYYLKDIPFLGINFGSKGFLMNNRVYIGENDTFESISHPLLDIKVQVQDVSYEHVAFNEAQIKTSGGHLIDLNLVIGEHSRIRLRGDGLLIVTPAGSTGYNASAGGPILPHSSSHFVATPLLAFTPRHIKPVLYENQCDVHITNNTEREQAISLYADSTPVLEKYTGKVEITVKKSSHTIKLLISNDYRRIWDAKVLSEQGFEMV